VKEWHFGLEPLSQTLALAPLLRRITSAAISLEHDDEAVEQLIKDLRTAESALASKLPVDGSPRVGPDATPRQRVYLDHSRAIGAFNASFPEYEIEVRGDDASGTVFFPVAYEGPPGVVHGGFLALFFDCAIQHHNCDVGTAGKTASLNISYRRPTPILTLLDFHIERSAEERRITSTARLSREGVTLCEATMDAVAGVRSRLPEVAPRQ
jgi:acyl-coenzyme A thioesterase PaaI-like protein